jgi:hypothetical protein
MKMHVNMMLIVYSMIPTNINSLAYLYYFVMKEYF